MTFAERLVEWLPFLWFLLALGILVALWMSGTFRRLFERITKFGGFGLSFEFTEKSARETRDSVEQSLGRVRAAIQRRLAADVRAAGLQEAFRNILDSTDLKSWKGFRATIHIQDPLYGNQLYQLLNYEPKGGGAGRTFSARAGIIGWAWRNADSETWYQSTDVLEKDLMQRWGMTKSEADQRESTDSKKLFLATPLFDTSGVVPIGVFYLDVDDRHVTLPRPDASLSSDEQNQRANASAKMILEPIRIQFLDLFNAKMANTLAELIRAAKKESPQLELEGQ